jgi:2,4-dienoyl-CoA reductase [(3E)-enoyl-CoA-producing], peroxisomal
VQLPVNLFSVYAVVGIDTVGTYNMCHEALKYLKRGGSGRDSGDSSNGGLFINISATLQYTAAWYQVHLSAAKVLGPSLNRSAESARENVSCYKNLS